MVHEERSHDGNTVFGGIRSGTAFLNHHRRRWDPNPCISFPKHHLLGQVYGLHGSVPNMNLAGNSTWPCTLWSWPRWAL